MATPEASTATRKRPAQLAALACGTALMTLMALVGCGKPDSTSSAATPASATAQPEQAQRNSGRVKLEGIPGLATQAQPLYQESHALLIGASQYSNGWKPLPGVKNDMVAVKSALVKHGFTVQVVADPTRDQLDTALRNFVAEYGQKEGNRLLVYFAGHGESLDAKTGRKLGYIVPVDAPLPQTDLAGFKRLAYSMDTIEVHARQIDARHALFVFDSCFSGTIFTKRANAPDSITDKTSRPVRQFITSGDAGQTVPDESFFRRRFVRALTDGDADLNGDKYITGSELGSYLEDSVINDTRKTQTPRYGKIMSEDLDQGDFVFASLQVEPTPAPPTPPPPVVVYEPEQEAWELAKRRDTVVAYQAYLSRYTNGRYADTARVAVEGLQTALPPQPKPAPQPQAATASQSIPVQTTQPGQTFKDCTDCPEMVVIPAGEFMMGSPASEPARETHEGPQRRVNIRSFALGQTEVTQGQWKAVMGSNPSFSSSCGDNCPVVEVSRDDIQGYLKKLNRKTGKQYRLPSEAEWEYAARAGCSTAFNVAAQCKDKIEATEANFGGSYSYSGSSKGVYKKKTLPVRSFKPNSFGLYDMHGNVGEWVQDCWHENYIGAPTDSSAWRTNCTVNPEVLRGGSWFDDPQDLRAAFRGRKVLPNIVGAAAADFRLIFIGFRLAMTVP